MAYLIIGAACLLVGWLILRAWHAHREDRKVRSCEAKVLGKRTMRASGNPPHPRREDDAPTEATLHIVKVYFGDGLHEVLVDEHTYRRLTEGETAVLVYRFPKDGKVEPLEVFPCHDD